MLSEKSYFTIKVAMLLSALMLKKAVFSLFSPVFYQYTAGIFSFFPHT